MKKYFTLILITFIYQIGLKAQTQKTYVKSFSENTSTVLLDLEGDVEIQEWEESFVRIHATVTLGAGGSEVLKSLVLLGRYSVESSLENGNLLLTSTPRNIEITYKGGLLEELVVYTVFVPRYTDVQTILEENPLAAALELN